MARTWTRKLAIGVSSIDEQHQQLFKRSDELIDALSHGKAQTELARLVDFLEQYVALHFGAEEKLMATHGYPKLTEHQRLHAEFTRQFGAIRDDVKGGNLQTTLVLRLNSLMGTWLVNHIGTEDTKIATFLKKDEESLGTD